jgi:hypothetical protein
MKYAALLLLLAANAYAQSFELRPVIADTDGTIVLRDKGSIDFAQLATEEPGEFAGWVKIYVNGQPLLMPVYRPKVQKTQCPPPSPNVLCVP